jgi:hypothetical protein
MGKLQRLSAYKRREKRLQEYGSIANGVGENPLNGKGLPLTGKAEGEKIVYSHMKV